MNNTHCDTCRHWLPTNPRTRADAWQRAYVSCPVAAALILRGTLHEHSCNAHQAACDALSSEYARDAGHLEAQQKDSSKNAV